jgi:hypothetical protein
MNPVLSIILPHNSLPYGLSLSAPSAAPPSARLLESQPGVDVFCRRSDVAASSNDDDDDWLSYEKDQMYLQDYDDHRHTPSLMAPSIDGEFKQPPYVQNKYSPKLVLDRRMEIQTTIDDTNDRSPISASTANQTVRAQHTSSIENNKPTFHSKDKPHTKSTIELKLNYTANDA